MLTRSADMTMDEDASVRTIERVLALWTQRPGTIVVPGHDVPMVLDNGVPTYIEGRQAGITAWFGETLETTTLFELAPDKPPRAVAAE